MLGEGIDVDITFRSDNGVFNYRACAVIVHNNHILAMKSAYFYPLFLKDKIFNLPDSLTILEEHE